MNKKVIAFTNLPMHLTFGIRDILLCFLAFERFEMPEWLQGIIYAAIAIRIIVSLWAFFAQEQVDLFKGD